MTYQNIGYWIGQANDTSTGRHPTGWTSGQRWLETAPEWMAMFDAKVTELTAMTADRDYWKNTVAHGDPDVWTNRYNAGYTDGRAQGQADMNPYRPPAGTGIILTASRGNKGAVQVVLNKTGYWFAYCNGGLTQDVSGTHYEGEVYMDSAPTYQWRSHDGRCIMATGWAAPIFANNGQPVNASFTVSGNDVGLDWPFTLYAVFVPTQQYPQ